MEGSLEEATNLLHFMVDDHLHLTVRSLLYDLRIYSQSTAFINAMVDEYLQFLNINQAKVRNKFRKNGERKSG